MADEIPCGTWIISSDEHLSVIDTSNVPVYTVITLLAQISLNFVGPKLFSFSQIVLKFCTEYDNITVVLIAKFQNDSVTNKQTPAMITAQAWVWNNNTNQLFIYVFTIKRTPHDIKYGPK